MWLMQCSMGLMPSCCLQKRRSDSTRWKQSVLWTESFELQKRGLDRGVGDRSMHHKGKALFRRPFDILPLRQPQPSERVSSWHLAKEGRLRACCRSSDPTRQLFHSLHLTATG